jgi:hypothetical protein
LQWTGLEPSKSPFTPSHGVIIILGGGCGAYPQSPRWIIDGFRSVTALVQRRAEPGLVS